MTDFVELIGSFISKHDCSSFPSLSSKPSTFCSTLSIFSKIVVRYFLLPSLWHSSHPLSYAMVQCNPCWRLVEFRGGWVLDISLCRLLSVDSRGLVHSFFLRLIHEHQHSPTQWWDASFACDSKSTILAWPPQKGNNARHMSFCVWLHFSLKHSRNYNAYQVHPRWRDLLIGKKVKEQIHLPHTLGVLGLPLSPKSQIHYLRFSDGTQASLAQV